jgi:hypothetical protein
MGIEEQEAVMSEIRSTSGSARSPALLRILVTGLAAAVLVGLLAGGRSAAQEVLTNDSVVGMVRAKLPEGVIIQKIRTSQRKFDTGTEALIQLKNAGVPDRVIEAMLGEASPGTGPAGAAAAAPAEPSIAHVGAAGIMPLKELRGEMEVSLAPFAGSRQEVVLPASRAEYRMTDKQPVFSTALAADQWVLVRLKPGKRDRNLPISKNDGWGWGGATFRQGPDPKYVIGLTGEPVSGGAVQIKPKQVLAPGEYAFVAVTRGQTNVVEVFDFGVD